MQIINLRCEYLTNPIGIDITQPRLSWQIISENMNAKQTAYRILVAQSLDALQTESNLVWDSGRIDSDESVNIAYEGVALTPQRRYYWTVQVWDEAGVQHQPQDNAFWQMGLGADYVWQAEWITYLTEVDVSVRPDENPAGEESDLFPPGDPLLVMYPASYLQREFEAQKTLQSATIYITARGLYEATLNGQNITDAKLTPGWTDYQHVIEYQTYDVTPLMDSGNNQLQVILADGWHSGYLGPWGRRGIYGERASLLAELHLTFVDGTQQIIKTDASWQGAEGAIRYAELYHGEYHDATRQPTDWQPIHLMEGTSAQLIGQVSQPLRVTQTLKPISITQQSADTYLVDMGQNMVGWVRLQVQGERGTVVRLRHAECLLADGTLDTRNLGAARATDTYILNGEGVEIYEPRFTYHGFRYVEVSGYPAELTEDAILGCVVHADLPVTGSLETSSPMVNKVFDNTLWGQRGNYNSVPTDCPQRAERLGWTGDVTSFALTGAYNMDCSAYYTRWIDILMREQSEEGGFPNVAPRVVLSMDGAPAWADVGIFAPYVMYKHYGDTRIVERSYPMMSRWMAYLERINPTYCWLEGRQLDFGDWLSYDDFTPTDLLATAIWAMDALWMQEMATAIGHEEDALRWQVLHSKIANAFSQAYLMDDDKLVSDTQGAYVLALKAQVIPSDKIETIVARLVTLIEARGWHLSTGFVSTPLLMPVLSEHGQHHVAFKLLLQDTVPSWGYMVKQGATTIWERWDGDIEMARIHGNDTSKRSFIHPAIGELVGMNSYNHYAFGAVCEWLYAYLLGIRPHPQGKGFKHVLIQPSMSDDLAYARGHYDSLYGCIEVAWRKEGEHFHTRISIPANVEATVRLASSDVNADAERYGGSALDSGLFEVRCGSGIYEFMTSA